jgi:hypothetical protein
MYILFFLLFHFKKTIYGKIHGALYPMFSQCEEYNVKSKLFIVKHYYSKHLFFLLFHFKRTIYGKIYGALYPMFSRCGEYNAKSKLFIDKHYYSKT